MSLSAKAGGGHRGGKWNMPSKALKKIARSGVYTNNCVDREDLWVQCLDLDMSDLAVRDVSFCSRCQSVSSTFV